MTIYGTALAPAEEGAVNVDSNGLLAVVSSPVSGATLTLPLGNGGRMAASVVDPITGAVLALRAGGRAAAAPRPVPQPAPRSRRFFLRGAAEIAVDEMRRCPPVSRYTNERVGTAGRPAPAAAAAEPGGQV
ncbi:MAG: hypothetical protein J3K34DRAFT_489077 [Monoraphidium minutum]|nr:MAG: hypothetical protein J3K34DRAFT_489077 [Monoraphidium minutum]